MRGDSSESKLKHLWQAGRQLPRGSEEKTGQLDMALTQHEGWQEGGTE